MHAIEVTEPMHPVPRWLKVIAGLGALSGLIVAFRLLPVDSWIERLKVFVAAQGALGYGAFAALYVVVSLVPGGPASGMTVAAGAIFGLGWGTLVVSVSSTTAATLAFLLARTLLRERIEQKLAHHPKLQRLSRAIARKGGRMVALVRLSPIFPFTLTNYALGLTPIRTSTYVLVSWLTMLPGTLAYVYLGTAVRAAAGHGHPAALAIRITLGVIGLVATVIVARIAERAIRAEGIEDEPTA